MSNNARRLWCIFTASILMNLCVAALGEVTYSVVIAPLPDVFKSSEPLIRANIVTAAQAWTHYVDAKTCTVEIDLSLDPNANNERGSGRSFTTARVGKETQDGKFVCEQGWASKLRTGKATKKADIEIVFDPVYFRTLWWDPRPDLRQAAVPQGMLDAQSVILHELGHALVFNGWIDQHNGTLPGKFISTYDRHVSFDGQNFFFNGPAAMKLWGAPVPLAHTHNNYHHVCETPTGAQAKLVGDLMNGVVFEYGRRYEITAMDLAILADCEIPVKK